MAAARGSTREGADRGATPPARSVPDSARRAAASPAGGPGRAPKRTRLTPEARRAQLIDLGVEMLSTRRLEDLSVELIAQSAGISRGLLFHYFDSKQDFHAEVARAAAQEMIRRTEPDTALDPIDALAAAVAAYVAYVEENPDNYKSLVRGAVSGDVEMRAIFDDTRNTLAQRIVGVLTDLGLDLGPRAELAIHGWVAYVEECTVRWLDAPTISRDELLVLLTGSLPAVVASASGAGAAELQALLAG